MILCGIPCFLGGCMVLNRFELVCVRDIFFCMKQKIKVQVVQGILIDITAVT